MTFGDKIRKLRIEKKMTQQKLGAMVGVSYRTIRAWEVDGRYPKQSSLYQKLADAFQCRVSYLMDDNETVCLGNDEPSEYSGAKQARQAFPEKIKELEMEGARISWDELTCVGYPVSEEATEKLCQDIEKFRKKAGMSEHSVKKEQLINWKILKQSEGQLLATNAYALLTSEYFSFSKTQCAVFKGTDRAVFLDKREFTGPIYTQIEEAVDFVLRNIRLGATIDGLVRKEKYELPPEAIREMIINAHCHRNLLDESCIQVAVYDDRLEVTSPGGLYNGLTYEEVMNGHSKIRNKGIANIFSQMGLVEAWGSGIKRILSAAEEYGLPKPRFQEFDNMFRVELFRNSFPMTNEKENIGEASEKHRRNIGSSVENRPQRYTAKDYKIAFRRLSIISG